MNFVKITESFEKVIEFCKCDFPDLEKSLNFVKITESFGEVLKFEHAPKEQVEFVYCLTLTYSKVCAHAYSEQNKPVQFSLSFLLN